MTIITGPTKALAVTLAVLVLSSLLNGCSWRLRGLQPLDTQLTELSINYSDRYSLLANAMENTLKQQGIAVLPLGQAAYTLHLDQENQSRRSVGVESNGLSAQYELQIQARFRVTGNNLEPKLLNTNVTRIYDYDQNDDLGKRAEEFIILKEMRQEIANRILRQISALTRQPDTIQSQTNEQE